MSQPENPQLEKFEDLERDLQADEDEARFGKTVGQDRPMPEKKPD